MRTTRPRLTVEDAIELVPDVEAVLEDCVGIRHVHTECLHVFGEVRGPEEVPLRERRGTYAPMQ